jgi:hypothetical protein
LPPPLHHEKGATVKAVKRLTRASLLVTIAVSLPVTGCADATLTEDNTQIEQEEVSAENDPLPSTPEGGPGNRQMTPTASPTVVAAEDYVEVFDEPMEFVLDADSVIIGRVVSEERGAASGEADARGRSRYLSVRVERLLAGRPVDNPLTVTVPGWITIDGVEHTIVVENDIRLEAGDRGVMSLVIAGDEAAFVNNEAVILVEEGQALDTNREGETVEELENHSESELIAWVEAVADATEPVDVSQ